jgi:hypothetical protein
VIGMLLGFIDGELHSTRRRAESGYARMWADGYEGMNR